VATQSRFTKGTLQHLNMELWKSTQEGFTKECNQLSEVYDGIVELLTIQKGLS